LSFLLEEYLESFEATLVAGVAGAWPSTTGLAVGLGSVLEPAFGG